MPLIYCITNGNKKITSKNRHILAALKEKFGAQFHLFQSSDSAQALSFIHALDFNCTHLIGVGGDGTFNVLLNAVCTHPDQAFQPILGIVPNGTGNDFFRSAGFQKNFSFLNAIEKGNFQEFDVGLIQTKTEHRYFANIADIGFGGAVVLELQSFRKRFGPNFSYGLAILKTFLRYKRPQISLRSTDFNYEGELLLAAFCNGSIFGDGLYIHPGARIDDGQLKLTLLGKVSLFDYLKNVIKVKQGKKIKHPEAHYLTVDCPIQLHCATQLLHAETDGEYMSGSQFEIDLFARKLKLLAHEAH